MEKIKFEKLNKIGYIYTNNNMLCMDWNNKHTNITEIEEDKIHIYPHIYIENKEIRGMLLDNKKIKKIKQLKLELQKKIEKLEKEAEEKAEKELQKEIKEIKNNGKITLDWREGTPLSDWTPSSSADEVILEENNLTEYIGGWGTKVKSPEKFSSYSVDKSGNFATIDYNEIKENTNKINKKKQQQEKEQKLKIQKLQKEKLKEAKKTNKKVFIRNVGGYDGDVEKPRQELGWVTVREIATPQGKIITEESK